VTEIMTRSPITIDPDALVAEALEVLSHKISVLPVVEDDKTVVGIVHLHDLLRLGAVERCVQSRRAAPYRFGVLKPLEIPLFSMNAVPDLQIFPNLFGRNEVNQRVSAGKKFQMTSFGFEAPFRSTKMPGVRLWIGSEVGDAWSHAPTIA